MAFEDFKGREEAYGHTIGGQLKAFGEGVVYMADHVDDIQAHRIQGIFKAANWKLNLVLSMLGLPQGMKFSADLPQVIAHQLGSVGVQEAEIKGHMDVSSSVNETLASKSEVAADGEGKIGWGPISAKVKIHAKSGVNYERKRASDYRAGVEWRVLIKRLPTPEQFARVIDTICHFIDKCTDLNETLVDKIATKLSDDAQTTQADQLLQAQPADGEAAAPAPAGGS